MATTRVTLPDRLIWKPDRMLLDDLVFKLEHFPSETWELGEECFHFYKVGPLVDEYVRFFDGKPDFQPKQIFELGIWDGGSTAFWFEWLNPDKHVAVDWLAKGDSEYFKKYVRGRGLEDRIRTYWGVNQADHDQLLHICRTEFDRPLDLIFDDASHLYEPSRISFETLFPLLRPGGFYMLEDWAWAHWKDYQGPNHPWTAERALTDLVFQFVESVGTQTAMIRSVAIYHNFVAIERGYLPAPADPDFELKNYISRRPPLS